MIIEVGGENVYDEKGSLHYLRTDGIHMRG